MKVASLTDAVRRRMSAKDRASLGAHGQTSEEAQSKFIAGSERELQQQLVSILRLRGIAFLWSRMDRKTTCTTGWPDLTFVVNGTPVAMEVKHGKGKLREEQEMIRDTMISNGWHWHCVRSLDEARAILDTLASP